MVTVPDPEVVQRWFAPPLQSHRATCVPSAVAKAGSSMHRPDTQFTNEAVTAACAFAGVWDMPFPAAEAVTGANAAATAPATAAAANPCRRARDVGVRDFRFTMNPPLLCDTPESGGTGPPQRTAPTTERCQMHISPERCISGFVILTDRQACLACMR